MSLSSVSTRTAVTILAGILASLLLAAVVGWWCYGQGYEAADNKGKAELATLRATYFEGSANATATALNDLLANFETANVIVRDLVKTRAELATARADINRRIAHAAASADPACAFGPEFVELLNEAFYGFSSDSQPEGPGTGGTASKPREAVQAGPGLRRDASVADVLTWGRDMGVYVRDLERTSAARLQLLEAWAQ